MGARMKPHLMDGSLHYRGRDSMFTINLSDNTTSAVPLIRLGAP